MKVSSESLQNYINQQDSQALSQLMRQHSDMVYAVCLRILGHHDQAADATQETFLQLLKSARSITGSLSGWLHRVATSKAIDLAKREGRRRQFHSEYTVPPGASLNEWNAVSLQVDEALENLDESSRELLIAYFLESRTTSELARARGVSQPTISRQIQNATDRLRHKLGVQQLVITTAALTGLLLDHAAQAAPPTIVKELGKMALAARPAVTATAASPGWFAKIMAALKTKIVTATVLFGTVVTVWVYQFDSGKKVSLSRSVQPTANRTVPLDQGSVNLSSPANTLNTLARLIPSGDMQSIQPCFIENSEAARALQQMTPLAEMLGRLGPPMQILTQEQNGDQAALNCRLTFTQALQVGNQVKRPGQSCELSIELLQQADQWKITRITSNLIP